MNVFAGRKLKKESIDKLTSAGLIVQDINLVEVVFLNDDKLIEFVKSNDSPWVFTSKNGVKGIVELARNNNLSIKSRNCFCIEPVTSDFAMLSGFQVLDSAPSSAELAYKIAEHRIKSVVHSTCENRRAELYDGLAKLDIDINALVTYEKSENPQRTNNAEMLLFFSPSQIDAFLVKQNLPSHAQAFCIGETTATYLKAKQKNKVIVPDKSTEKSMINAVLRYSKTYE